MKPHSYNLREGETLITPTTKSWLEMKAHQIDTFEKLEPDED